MEKEKFYGSLGARSQTASSKRNAQLKIWDKSETNKQSETIKPSRLNPKVQFGDNVVFLAAAQSGDIEEVERLVKEGADVNTVNADGLTALHQCCIDDDFEMVQVLVKHGANVDVQDNEGWSPLHAAASCGHEHTVRFLLESKAHPALVNNEGDTPYDLAEDSDEISTLIATHIETNNVDVDAARNREEAVMLADVNRMKNDPDLEHPLSPGGATPLHIAAAKGYIKVTKILISMKVEVDVMDDDGWTPLHAAVYWGMMEAAEILVSNGADITRKTKAGDTIEDLVDPELADDLDSLKKLKEEHISRNRRYAMPSRASRPSLTHSNSREDLGNSKSPNLLRRRSSKERSLVQKLDKEREKFPEHWADTTGATGNVNSSPSIQRREKEIPVKTAEVTELPASSLPSDNVNHNAVKNDAKSSEAMELAQDNNNSAKEEALINEQEVKTPPQSIPVNNQTSQVSSSDSSPTNSPGGSPKNLDRLIGKIAPSVSPKGSPKIAKRTGMSPNMLKRVGLWESQKTLTPGANSHVPTPLASSTPSTVENQRPANSSNSDVKRYSFQSKTISPDTGMPPRAMSFDHQSSGRLLQGLLPNRRSSNEIAPSKRASYDETRLLRLPGKEGNTYKASSLPRGATIALPIPTEVVSTSLPRGSRINTAGSAGSSERPKDKNKKGLSTPDENLEKEMKHGDNDCGTVVGAVSSSGLPTPSSATGSLEHGGEGRNESKEISMESTGSNRSVTEGSETKRKQHARRSRQNRQQTQPVDKEIMQKLLEQDNMKEKAREKSEESQSTGSSAEKDDSTAKEKVAMSAYKPVARPSSRPLNPTQSQQTLWSVPDKLSQTETRDSKSGSSTDNSTNNSPSISRVKISTADSPPQATTPSESSINDKLLTPLHPRTKSTSRRRPKKERRSTGLPFEAEKDEHIPDELAKIIVRKPTDILSADSSLVDQSPQSSMSEDYADSLGDSSISEELTRVRKLLVEEQQQTQRAYREKMEMEKDVNRLKIKMSELNRRHSDATRAYEQEKREKELKESRIIELENGSKNLQDLKKENQRLKDENGALIRVIGKLSRSPLPSSTV